MRDARKDLDHGVVGQRRSSRPHEHRKGTLRKETRREGEEGKEEGQISHQ